MNFPKPVFSTESSSVISIVRELHAYFRDLQSYYKVLQGQMISELEYTNKPEKTQELKQSLSEINCKLKYIHVLNNSASTVDEVIHLEEMLKEFRLDEKVVNV